MLARRIASLITSLPVKNDVVRGASFIMNAVSVYTCPFLFLVPTTDVVAIDLISLHFISSVKAAACRTQDVAHARRFGEPPTPRVERRAQVNSKHTQRRPRSMRVATRHVRRAEPI